MREELIVLIDKYGFYQVLNVYMVYMASKITPLVIGYDIVWKQVQEVSNTARYLDNSKKDTHEQLARSTEYL